MEETFFEKLTVKIFEHISRMNSYADEKDLCRNQTNYGSATAYADVLREFGHKVDIPAYGEDDYLRVDKFIVGDKTFQMKY